MGTSGFLLRNFQLLSQYETSEEKNTLLYPLRVYTIILNKPTPIKRGPFKVPKIKIPNTKLDWESTSTWLCE